MEPRLAGRLRGLDRVRREGSIGPARPLVRPAPRSAMFFPLVVLVAVLPGLYALTSWDLTPPGPWWGLRGLAVLDGRVLDQVPAVAEIKPAMEARAFRTVALQPPLYAWLEAVGLALSSDRDPRATVLPSYVAGALVVVLVYLHGRLWRGPGLGLIAAVLVGFNRSLLVQMQQATPTTLGLLGILTALLCYGQHLRVTRGESPPRWAWGGAAFWMVLGGVALGLSLMAVGLLGLVVVPIILLHQAYLRVSAPPGERERLGRWWLAWRNNPSLSAGAGALALALALAAPWHVRMLAAYGSEVLGGLLVTFDPHGPDRSGLLERLIRLAPATLPLGLYAAVRMVRLALIDENENREIVGGVFWVMWLAVAALVPAFWTSGPRPTFGLFLLVPLSLLAARVITDLANRSVPVRTLTWLAPATAVSIAWWISASLRGAIGGVLHGRADAATALGLHLALDLLVAVVLVTRYLDRWARRRDDRQRQVLGGFLAVVVAVTAGSGIREVWFRHRETDDLLMLRTMILRRDRERPFDLLAVVSPDSYRVPSDGPAPGGRLRFILRTALPNLPQRDLSTTDELLSLPEGQRLVILAGTEQRLPYAVQSKLGLEAIHPGRSGVLDAFATAHDPSRPTRR
jgi:4-amino-4-deoxy-L-arabinose transferase-like glycosyltransferase